MLEICNESRPQLCEDSTKSCRSTLDTLMREFDICIGGYITNQNLCRAYSRKPSLPKIDVIQGMKKHWESQAAIQRFLGECTFYHIYGYHTTHNASKEREEICVVNGAHYGCKEAKESTTSIASTEEADLLDRSSLWLTRSTRIDWLINQAGMERILKSAPLE